ncbi:MAG TPA: TonB-dependent receptor [Thermoanaerobaculia bacterium]|nr:TonB-dependent receptor [Thermoanaerobaculia bacterium]
MFLRRSLALVVLFLATSALAQTTGTIAGHVVDSSGAWLPGVTVEAKSPALQGTRDAVTDARGDYRLALLPPGVYTVSYKLEGFAAEMRQNITVSLGKETTLDASMKPAASGEITVTAEAPVLDTASTSIATNFSTRAIETLPTGRNYSSVVQVAPGVSSDANPGNPDQDTISVYGSSGAENSFFIDGMNTTGVEYGFQGKQLNFEFIREVNVKTGGYEAEFGRSTGGIVNVITKSGGNEYTGDVFGYYDSDSWQTSAKEVVASTPAGFRRNDAGVDVGGYVMKDKLWFFAAYDRVRNGVDNALPEGPAAGSIVTSNSRRNLGSAKLTWNAAPNQSIVFTFLQDPRVDTGAINDANHTLIGDSSTYLGRQDFGGRDYAARYDGTLASNWILSGSAARHRETNSVGPATAAGNSIQYRDTENNFFQTGGFGLIQEKSFDRRSWGASATRYLAGHEIKGGLDFETQDADVMKMMSGGQEVDVIFNKVNPSKPIYKHSYWTTPDATVGNAPVSALNASPRHKNTALYLQDRWTGNNVTINAGLRWDRQQIIDASGVTQIDMKKDYAPRLGIAWDPRGDHTTKVFASYGRFYEQIPMDLVIRSFSYERQPRIVNYSPTSTTPDPNAEADYETDSAILGGFTEPSDPNIKNQYLTEYIVGGEREVIADVAVGIKGIYRSYGRVIEDFLCADDGTYCIGNPGEGIMKDIFTLDYSQTFPAPKPERKYKGVQFDVTKRYSHNWQAIASYIYSKLDGNYDGEYAPFTNIGADPNISAAYDYYDFFTNGSDLTKITNRGPLSNDRRHQFKVSGVYNTPYKLNVGFSAYWRSGTPLTRYGYSDAYGRYEFFLNERGAEGRTPSNYDADLHLGYPIAFHGTTINLLLDVFNILNTQRAVLLDQRWGFTEDDNKSPTPVNPDYGKPFLRTPPTSARLGVRITF